MSEKKKRGLDLDALDANMEELQKDRERQIIARVEGEAEGLDQVIAKINLNQLLPDPYQPRKAFVQAKIDELAKSMHEHGLQEPLVVRPAQGPQNRGKYWVVSGERRLRAAKQLGWSEIDCRIKNLDPIRAAVLALALNVHREGLSEIEKAESLQRLKTMTAYTWDQVAGLTGISHAYVRQLAGLLNVSDDVKDKVRSGELAARTAIALKALPEHEQGKWAQRVIAEGLTAEQVREQTSHIQRPRAVHRTPNLQIPERLENAAAYQAPAPESLAPSGSVAPGETRPATRPGTRTKLLEDSIQALKNIRKVLGREAWYPSEVTERQQGLIHELYAEVAGLHQEVSDIRMPFRPDPKGKEKDENTKRLLPF